VHHAHKSGTTNIEVAHRGSAQNQKYLVHKWRALGYTNSQGKILKGIARLPQTEKVEPVISQSKTKLRIVVDGFIFQWQSGQPLGISRVWSNLLPELTAILPDVEIILLKRKGFPTGLKGFREVEVPAWQMGNATVLENDDQMLARICSELEADIFLSTYYTRAPGVRNIQMMYDMIPEVFGWDLSNPEWLSKQRAVANASDYITISNATKQDLMRFYGIAAEKITVAHCGVSSTFRPAGKTEVNAFRQKYGIHRPYFLLVGKREGYKNPIPCYHAFQMLNDPRLQLVAIGGASQLSVEERKAISLEKITVLPNTR
jgi:glycosyltransferase involved in cell wall biosynthesis